MTIRELLNAIDDDQRINLVIDTNEDSTSILGTAKGIWNCHPEILDKYVVGLITADKDEIVLRVHKGDANA
jgi:hypothetical protein